jgi:uncharacterized protein (DUF1697 family)
VARSDAAPSDVVALLRAVNVGGCTLRMTDLKALVEDLGYARARTVLQTGNVLFRPAGRREPARIEQQLERELQTRLAIQAAVFVRRAAEWSEIVESNPFRAEAAADPAHLVLMLLKSTPSASALASLQAAIKAREVIRGVDRRLYIVYPDGIGRSKLTNTLIERTLGTPSTARNWNTVLKLRAALEAPVGV